MITTNRTYPSSSLSCHYLGIGQGMTQTSSVKLCVKVVHYNFFFTFWVAVQELFVLARVCVCVALESKLTPVYYQLIISLEALTLYK